MILKRSRKKTSRTKARHHRQMRDQKYRQHRREEKEYSPEQFSLMLLFRKRSGELLLIVIVIAAIVGIIFLGPDKKAAKEMMDSVSAVVEGQEADWEKMYPRGYKVIVLTDKDIIHTVYDTLPEDLKINWDKMFVERIQIREFGSLDEKIKIEISGISYVATGTSDLSVVGSFIRNEGVRIALAQLGDLDFMVEIVEDTGDQVFCLFGLKNR